MSAKAIEKIDIDDPQYRTTPLQQGAASCTGALITSLFVTPLDVVKIRLQAQKKAMSRCFLYCNGLMDHICDCEPNKSTWFQRPGQFNGTIDAFIKITKTEGVSSLWSGLSPTLVLAIPATIIYFVTYEQLRLALKDRYNLNRSEGQPFSQPTWIPMVSGGSARIISATVVSPLELIRTKMQSKRLSYFEIGEALKSLIRQDGIKGLWTGIFPTLLRDVPFSAIYWMSYECIKSHGPGIPSFGYSFFAGAVSGAIAATLTVPFDVVKTHQQIELGEQVLSGAERKPTTTFAIIQHLYHQYGYRGLVTGLVPRLIKVAPACAIMIATFEHSKIAFNRLAKTHSNTTGSNVSGFVGETSSNTSKSKDAQINKSLLRDINVASAPQDVL